MSELFSEKVYEVLRKIPKGKVVTYGQLARLAGKPRAARAVGNILHANPDPIGTPCFKVVNSKGELAKCFAFGGIEQQKDMLIEDGIKVENYTVDLSQYQWHDV